MKCITNMILIIDLFHSSWYTYATNKEDGGMFLLKNTIKGETYLYFAVQKREGKKTRPIRIKSLGRLSDLQKKDPDIIAHLRKQLDEINGSPEKTENVIDSSLKPRERNTVCCGNLIVLSELRRLGILGCFSPIRTKSEFDAARISADLICERILDPQSKLASYERISDNPFYQVDYGLNDVYRTLDEIDTFREDIYRRFAKRSREGRETRIVNYDTTNFYFEIEEQDEEGGLRRYGISKEHRPNPIVQMGLFVDQDGFPIFMNVNPGNTGECRTAIPSQLEMSKAGISEYIYCADAGIASSKIKLHNSVPGRRYVVAQSLRRLDGDRQKWALSEDGWHLGKKKVSSTKDCPSGGYLWKEDIFALSVGRGSEATVIPERLIVIYSKDTAAWQANTLDEQLRRAAKKVENGIRSNPNSPDRLVSVTKCTDEGEVADNEVREIDSAKAEEEAKYHGFYAIATNILKTDGASATDVIAINSGRWVVESFFREMKSTCSARPLFLSADARIRTHLFLCVLSVYVLMNMRAELLKKGIKASAHDIKECLGKTYATKEKLGYVLGSEDGNGLADIRKGLLEVNGLQELGNEYIPERKMNEILKKMRS